MTRPHLYVWRLQPPSTVAILQRTPSPTTNFPRDRTIQHYNCCSMHLLTASPPTCSSSIKEYSTVFVRLPAVSRFPRVAACSIRAQQCQSAQSLVVCCCTVDAVGRARILQSPPLSSRRFSHRLLLRPWLGLKPTQQDCNLNNEATTALCTLLFAHAYRSER